jgi:hypothetical protein
MMQVNNKYNIGDKVYFINAENKAECSVVKGVFVYAYKDHTSIMYNMESGMSTVNEEDAFATERDLKEYVFNDLIEFV